MLSKSRRPMVLAYYETHLFLGHIAYIFIVCPECPDYVWIIIFLSIVKSFTHPRACFGDPGVSTSRRSSSQASVRCRSCLTMRGPRTRHCSICGYCITRLDHHCVWVNNCVGRTNQFAFFGEVALNVPILIFFLLSVNSYFAHYITLPSAPLSWTDAVCLFTNHEVHVDPRLPLKIDWPAALDCGSPALQAAHSIDALEPSINEEKPPLPRSPSLVSYGLYRWRSWRYWLDWWVKQTFAAAPFLWLVSFSLSVLLLPLSVLSIWFAYLASINKLTSEWLSEQKRNSMSTPQAIQHNKGLWRNWQEFVGCDG